MTAATRKATSLRWGLLSTAHINRRLIPAIRAAKRARLVAVASRSQSRAESYAAEWDIPRAYGSYEALLEDPQVDVIYISLPNALHAKWTVRVAEAGKHVLCEKPLAVSVQECDEILAAAQAAGVVAVEAVMYLHHPLLRRARDLVQEGMVGEVVLVRGALAISLERSDDIRWDAALGGGSLWDVGSYPVSFIRWIAGEPQEVFGWQGLSESGVDHTFAGLLRYGNGVLGVFDCSFRESFRSQAEVFGTEGTLTIEHPYVIGPQSRILLSRDSHEEEICLPYEDPYGSEVDALTAAVLDGSPLPVPLSMSRANVAALAALYESADRGVPHPVAAA